MKPTLSSFLFYFTLKQLYPLGTTSQFQAREFFHVPPPPTHPPPPIPAGIPAGISETATVHEPIYAYPSSLYGTLPRGPPRPVKRPSLFEQPLEDVDEEEHRKSLTGSLINYATFRQNISNDAGMN